MKVINSSGNDVRSSKAFDSFQFNIKSENLGHIISLLRDQIYSDKPMAVIRELTTNALDACIENGKTVKSVIVTLPSKLNPVFSVRDNGRGLSREEVKDIYVSYGASTKRSTNNAVGMFGIGAKSPLAYTDSFLVTSYHNGVKTVYNCAIDASNVGTCIVIHEEKSNEPSGIVVSVNIKMDDIAEFTEKALDFFKYWNELPMVEGYSEDVLKQRYSEKDKVLFGGDDWTIFESENRYYSRNNNGVVVMGNIAYPIDWNNIRSHFSKGKKNLSEEQHSLFNFLSNSKMVMRFKIGELQFAPSREALQYTEYTNNMLENKIKKILGEIEGIIQKTIASAKDLVDAHSIYSKLFDYGSGLYSLSKYFENKLKWNNICINGGSIQDVGRFDVNTGELVKDSTDSYNNPNFKSILRTFRKGNHIIHCEKNYRNSHISCSDKIKVMLYDINKVSYIRKAVNYLFSKDSSLYRVYVLEFGNTAVKDAAFKKFNLQYVPMVKYSDIEAEVKKTIVRSGGGGVRTTSNGKKYVKYITADTYIRSYGSEKSCWSNEEIDLSTASGLYIPMENNSPKYKGNVNNLRGLVDFVKLFNNIKKNNTIVKIYGFGSQITDSKTFKANSKNWTNVEDYIADKIKDSMKDETTKTFLAWSMAHNESYNENIKSFIKNLCGKLNNKNNDWCKLNKIAQSFDINNKDMLSLFKSSNVNLGIKDKVNEIKALYENITEKYPMLVNQEAYNDLYRHNYYSNISNKTIDMYVNYINMVDKNN